MANTYWHRQTTEEPLFPDLVWSKPENKAQAGKLLIIGGNAHGFSAAAEAYSEAAKAGIGTCRVLLPDSLQKTVGRVFEAGEYAPSTPSGSFSQKSIAELLSYSQWADGVLLAGDFGRNSETAIVLEQFIAKYSGQLTITQDAADYFIKSSDSLLNRKNTTLVISFAQLQKISTSSKFAKAFVFDMDFLHLIDNLHEFTKLNQPAIVVKHLSNIFSAYNGEVSSTKLKEDLEIWRVKAAAHAAVWQTQNPSKIFEAITSSITEI